MKFSRGHFTTTLLAAVMLAFATLAAAASAQEPAAEPATVLPATDAAVTAPANTVPIDSIVAVVDEDVILRSQLDNAVGNITAQYATRPGQLPPLEVLQKQVLERLILMRLQLARAESAGIRVSDAEVEQAVQSVAQQNQLNPEQLREQLARDGLSYQEFRSSLREELLAQRLRQGYVRSKVTVSDSEVDAALAAGGDNAGQVHVAHLLVALPDGASPEQIATAQQKIEGIKQLLDRGEIDFNAAAIRYSDSPNALDGGDLGWRSLSEIPALFANLLKEMRPGDVTPPLRGPSGFQLLKLVETRDAQASNVTEYQARGIMVRKSEVVSSDEARQKIERARARIVAGEDFAKVATEVSDDTLSKNQGGDMGWFQQGAYGSAVGAQIATLADDELSAPFESEAGWHIIKRLGSREQDVTDTLRRNEAREAIARRKSEEEFERFLRQMRSESYVDIRLGSG